MSRKIRLFRQGKGKIHAFYLLVFAFTLMTLQRNCFASAEPPAEQQDKFNAGEMIMHHIKDAHEWHLWGHTSIPLPVILYIRGQGFLFASSSDFQDEHHNPVPYQNMKLEHNRFYTLNEDGSVNEERTAGIMDFSITKNVLALFISVFLILLIFLSLAKTYKKRGAQTPKGMQSFIEPVIVFVRDEIAKNAIGPKYERYLPYLLTLFFFIWLNNILGLIPIFPGGANLTGNVAVSIVMALFTFVITAVSARKHYWMHVFWMPGVPVAIKPLLSVIEFMGLFIKPVVLVIRLFANITAGHIVILVFISLIFIFGDNGTSWAGGLGASIPATIFAIFLNLLEILVGAIQAYVFTLLSAVYFGMALAEEHH